MKDKGHKKDMKKPSADKSSRKNIEHKDVIVKSCASMVLPIALVLGAYVILHGHLSPGGGFQGGVLIGGAVAILYAAYGSKGIQQMFHLDRMKASESIGALGFLFIASLGIIYGVSGFRFFSNSISRGTPGELYSSGTIFWMNFAVGYKVLAGIGALIFIMVSTLNSSEE
jgi:multicomponent Na+:H+ antiporter subunit B